jgi:predicted O-methyltransferase YrrM
LHSPFLFDFYTQTVLATSSRDHQEIERLRQSLLNDTSPLPDAQIGAGSTRKSKNRSVSSIASSSLAPRKQALFFSNLVAFLGSKHMLELGTCLGLTTAYLSKAAPLGKIVSIEGDAAVAAKAKSNFQTLALDNVSLVVGDFDDELKGVLESFPSLDFVYFDGNHQLAATLRYFQACLSKIQDNTVFVFHDIYWSREMESAWKIISARQDVRISIDMFHFGLVFFHPHFPKQHFVLKF